MPRKLTIFAIAIAVAACGTRKTPGASAAPEPVPPVARASPSKPPPATGAVYVYSPEGKRDPFTNARRPSGDGPLQQWPVDRFNLQGTVTGIASPSAVILDPESRAWLVRIGDRVGNNDGKVTSIARDEIIVTEKIGGPTGQLFPQPIKLGLASPGKSIENERQMINVPPAK